VSTRSAPHNLTKYLRVIFQSSGISSYPVVILQGQRKPNDQDKEINGISNKIIKILKVPLKRNGELFKIYVICGPPHSTELLPMTKYNAKGFPGNSSFNSNGRQVASEFSVDKSRTAVSA
jgi:hypothetical protein